MSSAGSFARDGRSKSQSKCACAKSDHSKHSKGSKQGKNDGYEVLAPMTMYPSYYRHKQRNTYSPEVNSSQRSSQMTLVSQDSDNAFPVVMPEHRPSGSKSRKKYTKTKERKDETCCSPSSVNNDESSEYSRRGDVGRLMERELFKEFFLGAMKEKELRKFLKINEFRLYYKKPKSSTKVVSRLPLQVGYMSSEGEVYHFSVACVNYGSHQQSWHVVTGNHVTTFSTLSALVRYHKTYSYMDQKTGKIEVFPINYAV